MLWRNDGKLVSDLSSLIRCDECPCGKPCVCCLSEKIPSKLIGTFLGTVTSNSLDCLDCGVLSNAAVEFNWEFSAGEVCLHRSAELICPFYSGTLKQLAITFDQFPSGGTFPKTGVTIGLTHIGNPWYSLTVPAANTPGPTGYAEIDCTITRTLSWLSPVGSRCIGPAQFRVQVA